MAYTPSRLKNENAKKSRPGITQESGHLILWFLIYLVSLLFWEFYIHFRVYGNLTDDGLWLVAFAPAEAMFLTVFSGWSSKKVLRRILGSIPVIAAFAFYVAQYIYYCVFGSMFSVAMAAMGGDAIENFGWALSATLQDYFWSILVTVIPLVVLLIGMLFVKKELPIRPVTHIASLALAAAFWFLAVVLLPLGGTETFSPYGAFHSQLVDTDTASGKIGVLTNSVLELKAVVFNDATSEAANEDAENGRTALETGGVVDLDAGSASGTSETDVPADSKSAEEAEETQELKANILEQIDFNALAASTDDSTLKELCEYFAEQTGTMQNEMTGLFEGYNLVYICAESFDTEALDPDVNPTLAKMASNGIVLTNYWNSFKNTTTNGEYALLTSLWPDVSRTANMGRSVGSFPQSADNYMPMGLGTLFNSQFNAGAYGYHNYDGSYYNRKNSLINLGFTTKFAGDGMTFTSSWPASDYEMLQQSVDDYINDDQFVAYYMTFSGHGAYSSSNAITNRNLSYTKEQTSGKGYNDNAVGYLANNHELDKAMEYLLQRLEEAGKLDNTVIVIAGDHYPYYLYDAGYKSITGEDLDQDFGMYESTCIIYCAGLEEPITVDTPCCNVDILPTILNLFGVDYESRLLAGTDIFSDGTHVATLYNRSFITDKVRYNNSTGKAEWLVDTSAYTDEQLQAYLDSMISYVKSKYSMSLKIADTDFYRFAWVGAGIVTDDEIEVQKIAYFGYNRGGTSTDDTAGDDTTGGDTGTTGDNTGDTGTGGGNTGDTGTTGGNTGDTGTTGGNTGDTGTTGGNTGDTGTTGGNTGDTGTTGGNTGDTGTTGGNTGDTGSGATE